jgi:predicted alpha/beta-fold hydrolase
VPESRKIVCSVNTDFSPAWFLTNPHLQTIWGRVTRPRQLVALRREWLETPDGDELVLDHLDQPLREPSLHFVLMHGLEGSSNSVYMQGVLSAVERHGHSATAMNFRSCARDPQNLDRMLPNRRPRFYHSGETGDFGFLVHTLRARFPERRIVAFGASLGGNVLLKWLGENPGQSLVSAAGALSVPYDLGAGARHLETTRPGRFYVARFLSTLRKKATRPDIAELIDVAPVLRARTFKEFDDAATGPLHGFVDAEDYYTRSSSIHFLGRITTPTLALNAEDDPFLPPDILPRAKAAASPHVDFRTTPAGGHVGFIRGDAPWRCEYWAEDLVVRWLIAKAEQR